MISCLQSVTSPPAAHCVALLAVALHGGLLGEVNCGQKLLCVAAAVGVSQSVWLLISHFSQFVVPRAEQPESN